MAALTMLLFWFNSPTAGVLVLIQPRLFAGNILLILRLFLFIAHYFLLKG